MLTIRLVRTGKKNASSFRIVLVKKTSSPKSGRFLEILGNYNPRLPAKDSSVSGRKEVNLKKERIKYWLSQGVQTSETVHNLLVKEGVIEGPKIKKKFKAKKKEEMEKKEEKDKKEIQGEKEEAKKGKDEKAEVEKEAKDEVKEKTKEEKEDKGVDKSSQKSNLKTE